MEEKRFKELRAWSGGPGEKRPPNGKGFRRSSKERSGGKKAEVAARGIQVRNAEKLPRLGKKKDNRTMQPAGGPVCGRRLPDFRKNLLLSRGYGRNDGGKKIESTKATHCTAGGGGPTDCGGGKNPTELSGGQKLETSTKNGGCLPRRKKNCGSRNYAPKSNSESRKSRADRKSDKKFDMIAARKVKPTEATILNQITSSARKGWVSCVTLHF